MESYRLLPESNFTSKVALFLNKITVPGMLIDVF